jgi:hypothetical protein
VIVRRMSAHPVKISAVLATLTSQQANNDAASYAAMSSPKAEVTSSNLVGRATWYSSANTIHRRARQGQHAQAHPCCL